MCIGFLYENVLSCVLAAKFVFTVTWKLLVGSLRAKEKNCVFRTVLSNGTKQIHIIVLQKAKNRPKPPKITKNTDYDLDFIKNMQIWLLHLKDRTQVSIWICIIQEAIFNSFCFKDVYWRFLYDKCTESQNLLLQ